MEFIDLIRARDEAIAHDNECAASEADAVAAHEKALAELTEWKAERAAAQEIIAKAHQAIAGRIAEKGEHFLVDQRGTVTVYKGHSELPGYLAVQPIPGTTKAS